MIPVWVAFLLLATNVATLGCLQYQLFHRHLHDWQPWDDWMADEYRIGCVRWVRFRQCRTCTTSQSQTTGNHKCPDMYSAKGCRHKPTDDRDRIGRLERDLGLDP